MERVLFLALLAVIVAFCFAESDPFSFGSGSDTLIISPSTKKPSMDSTDDSGSGVDDEDDNDGEDDSTDISTTFETTRERTTTEQTTEATTKATTKATTTTPQTTTKVETTTDYSPTTSSGSGPDTDYEYEGSGSSGSGDVKIISSTPKYETTTDIYIHESTTSDDGLIAAHTDRRTTTEKPRSKSNIIFKTTAKPDSTVKYTDAPKTVQARKTNPSTTETPSTKDPTTKMLTTTKRAPPTTKSDPTSQKLVEKTTPRGSIIEKTSGTAPDSNTIDVTTSEMPETSDPRTDQDKTTPWDEGDIMAHPKDDKDGFTLTTEVIAGVVGCAVLALLLIAFLMYRLKKKDEGSYLLDESNADEYKKAHDKEAFI